MFYTPPMKRIKLIFFGGPAWFNGYVENEEGWGRWVGREWFEGSGWLVRIHKQGTFSNYGSGDDVVEGSEAW